MMHPILIVFILSIVLWVAIIAVVGSAVISLS